MKTNWKVRLNNPVFWFQVLLAVLLPMATYFNMEIKDLTSWEALGKLIVGTLSNPFLLGTVVVSLWNAWNDPTTSGLSDSEKALTYEAPKKEEQ